MKKIITAIIMGVLLGWGSLNAQLPKDNPYFSKYDSCPIWMDELKWNHVVDVQDFSVDGQQSWDSAVKMAINHVHELGGGVVYFPAGEYLFDGNLEVLDGVILRGEIPVNNIAKEDNFAPPTRLVFPKYEPVFEGDGTPNNTAFKRIYAFGDKSNVGLVYMDINRGRIHFSISGQNLLIFGVRQNNVAEPQADIPRDYPMMTGWQRFAYRHGRNIRAYAYRHVSVVNCRINDFENNSEHPIPNDGYDQPGAVVYGHYTGNPDAPGGAGFDANLVNGDSQQIDTTHIKHGHWYRFSYTDHYGIGAGAAKINPANLEKEIDQKVEVIDNWIYTTMRVGIFASGIGLRIANNVRQDEPDKRNYVHATGWRVQTNNSATLENRALNFAGNDIVIENNDLRVYRHKILYSGYSSVDGEGILIQTQDIWGDYMDKVYIRNNKVNSYIGIYDMKMEIRNLHITGNDMMNKAHIMVFKKEIDYRMDDIFVEDNYNVTSITLGWRDQDDGNQVKARGTNINIKNNEGSGNLNYACQSIVEGNVGFTDITNCQDQFLITATKPYNGQLNCVTHQDIKVVFNQAVKNTQSQYISIKNSESSIIPISVDIQEKSIILNHSGFFMPNETYTVSLQENAVLNQMDEGCEPWEWYFTTMPKPYAVTTLPSDGAQYMDVEIDIIAEFNQDVSLLSPEQIILMEESTSSSIIVNASYDGIKRQIVISHDGLEENASYRVIIPEGTVENNAGFQNDTIQWTFCTGDKTLFSNVSPGISEEERLQADIYPVPAKNSLFVQASRKILSYTITNMQGQVQLLNNVSKTAGDVLEIALGQINPGMYILVLQTEKGKIPKVFIKE